MPTGNLNTLLLGVGSCHKCGLVVKLLRQLVELLVVSEVELPSDVESAFPPNRDDRSRRLTADGHDPCFERSFDLHFDVLGLSCSMRLPDGRYGAWFGGWM